MSGLVRPRKNSVRGNSSLRPPQINSGDAPSEALQAARDLSDRFPEIRRVEHVGRVFGAEVDEEILGKFHRAWSSQEGALLTGSLNLS